MQLRTFDVLELIKLAHPFLLRRRVQPQQSSLHAADSLELLVLEISHQSCAKDRLEKLLILLVVQLKNLK